MIKPGIEKDGNKSVLIGVFKQESFCRKRVKEE